MKKDEALQRREKVLASLNEALAKLNEAPLADDGKLYHSELDGENRWAQRLSRPGAWPHVPDGQAALALPGLRYEVWYFQKRPEAWIGLLCSQREAAGALIGELKPMWKEWVAGGKFARRYQPLDKAWQSIYEETQGIWRSLPLNDKLEQGLIQLVRDTLPGIEKALAKADADGTLAAGFRQASQERDLLAELAAKFNKPR